MMKNRQTFRQTAVTVREAIRRISVSGRQNREKGAITVAETLIALAVGATILATVFAGIPALQSARHANAGLNGLSQTVTTIRGTFGPRNSFAGLTTDLAKTLAGFPRNFVSGSDVIHPWGGTITIGVGATSREFTVSFNDVTARGCTSIVTSTLDMADVIDVGGTEVDLNATDDPTTISVDESEAANIAGLCEDDVDIEWTFSA